MSFWCIFDLNAQLTTQQLQEIYDGFETRRDLGLESLRGKDLSISPIQDPLRPGGGLFLRNYSFSITDFAIGAFWLNEQIEAANDALDLNSQFYIDDRLTRNDRDSFYWSADTLCRIVEFFGQNGSVAPGRLRKSSEDLILELMWLYAKENSKVDSLNDVYSVYALWKYGEMGSEPMPLSAEVEQSQTWDIIESENHHSMKFSTLWHFSKLLSESDDYKNLAFDDGNTAAEHYAAWTEYAKEYCRQRAKKGLFVEMADDGYNSWTLNGLYNFYDFADDNQLKNVAGKLLILYYASWAQEQINGVRGGGKSRIGGDRALTPSIEISRRMWYYAALGSEVQPRYGLWGVLTSNFRLPLVVLDIMLDIDGRGNYEIFEHPLGLAKDEFYRNPHYKLKTEYGGITRYSYCTPDFILGLPMAEDRRYEDWTLISSQSRWQGVIFRNHLNSRIVPQCEPIDGTQTFNQQRGVQRLGTMITQKLVEHGYLAGDMRVYFSGGDADMILTQQEGWVFARTVGAFAAVRPAWGGYTWDDSNWMRFNDDSAPVIIEVWQSSNYSNSFTLFRNQVLQQIVDVQNGVLTYTGLNNSGVFTFYTQSDAQPLINGAPISFTPGFTYQSPFINSDYDSDKIIVSKDGRIINLDFNYQPVELFSDINNDGIVNIKDLSIFSDNWLRCNDPGKIECIEYAN